MNEISDFRWILIPTFLGNYCMYSVETQRYSAQSTQACRRAALLDVIQSIMEELNREYMMEVIRKCYGHSSTQCMQLVILLCTNQLEFRAWDTVLRLQQRWTGC